MREGDAHGACDFCARQRNQTELMHTERDEVDCEDVLKNGGSRRGRVSKDETRLYRECVKTRDRYEDICRKVDNEREV